MNPILRDLQQRAGIHFMGVDPDFQAPNAVLRVGYNGELACDAQPALVTHSNSAIPAFLTTYVDPKLIEVLVAPMKAAEITGGEIKKGDFTTETAMFGLIESTGQVSSYGDYSEDGVSGANVNWPQRQSYTYQVMTQWGERELARMGLARIDWANRLNIASVLTLNKFQNKSYFFGVDGLENYGLLNDPSLPSPITPGAGEWTVSTTAAQVLEDIASLFAQLQSQANGLVDLGTKMTLAMSPGAEAVGLTKVSQYNVSVSDQIKKLYPNLTVKTAPEYATDSGNLLQLIADELEGQRTVSCAFTEKLRAHPIVVGTSNFKQKKSQGTWGTVVFRPFLIAGMLGV